MLFALLLSLSCQKPESEQKAGFEAQTPPKQDGTFQIDPQDQCPVCGMKPAHHARHAAAIVYRDGKASYTCSNNCAIRIFLDPEKFVRRHKEDLARFWFQEYFTGKPLKDTEVMLVLGSDWMGPMGPETATVARDQAPVFTERHGGEVTTTLQDLTLDTWHRIHP
jgi:nitrous oxide reductase accessory protein NosL